MASIEDIKAALKELGVTSVSAFQELRELKSSGDADRTTLKVLSEALEAHGSAVESRGTLASCRGEFRKWRANLCRGWTCM